MGTETFIGPWVMSTVALTTLVDKKGDRGHVIGEVYRVTASGRGRL